MNGANFGGGAQYGDRSAVSGERNENVRGGGGGGGGGGRVTAANGNFSMGMGNNMVPSGVSNMNMVMNNMGNMAMNNMMNPMNASSINGGPMSSMNGMMAAFPNPVNKLAIQVHP